MGGVGWLGGVGDGRETEICTDIGKRTGFC